MEEFMRAWVGINNTPAFSANKKATDPMNAQLQQQIAALQNQTILAIPAATSSNFQSAIIACSSISTLAIVAGPQFNHLNNDNNEIFVFEPSSSIESVEQVYEEYYDGLIVGVDGCRSWSLKKIEET